MKAKNIAAAAHETATVDADLAEFFRLMNTPRTPTAEHVSAAQESIDRLRRSERGARALGALAQLLWDEGTWSLDDGNQRALADLLKRALDCPDVREMVQVAGRRR